MSSRVVFVVQTSVFGGTEKHLIELVRALDRSHHSIIWYHPVDFFTRFLEGYPNVRVLARRSKVTIRTAGAFWFRLAGFRPRAVVLVKGTFDTYPWFGYLAARLAGAKRLIVIEQLIADPAPPTAPPTAPATGLSARLRRAFGWRARHMMGKRLQGHLADFTVGVSEAVRQRLVAEYKYPAHKTVTIHNGVDLSSFRSLDGERDSAGSPDSSGGPMQIICLARLSREKRLDLLLEALAIVPGAVAAWQCTIVGGGKLEAELRAKTESLGLASAVRFTGHADDVRPYLEKADLFVLSSEKEGLPLSLGEAMAFGLACVVTDVGGNREIVLHQRTGLVVEFGSAEKLADAITYLLEHPEERKRMGQEGRRHVCAHFDANQQLDRYRELLRV